MSQEQEVSHSEIFEVFKKNLYGVHFEYYILLIIKTPFPLKGYFNFCWAEILYNQNPDSFKRIL